MSYQVKNADIFGRVGSGLGAGLGEQAPKEMEHYRLSKGLKDLEKDSANLDPLQFQTRASSIYGISPQSVQSLGELNKQRTVNNALKAKANEAPDNPFKKQPLDQQQTQEPSLTTREPIEATLKNELAPTLDDIKQRAGQLIESDPGYYAANPQMAMSDAQKEYDLARQRNQDLQARRGNEQEVQSRIEDGLDKQKKRLNAEIPGGVYTDIEKKAIASVLPKSEGGEGLTEQQAQVKYGKELDTVSKQYEKIKQVGGWKLLSKTPEGNKKSLEAIREGFKDRDDLYNFARTMQAEQNISPSKAFYLAYPPSDIKELNNALVKLPELKKEKVPYSTTKMINPEIAREKTYEAAPKLFKAMGNKGSPLAIYEELNSRGYDGNVWMDYVKENRKKLTEEQIEQTEDPYERASTIDDNWLFYFSGLKKLVEQK